MTAIGLIEEEVDEIQSVGCGVYVVTDGVVETLDPKSANELERGGLGSDVMGCGLLVCALSSVVHAAKEQATVATELFDRSRHAMVFLSAWHRVPLEKGTDGP